MSRPKERACTLCDRMRMENMTGELIKKNAELTPHSNLQSIKEW